MCDPRYRVPVPARADQPGSGDPAVVQGSSVEDHRPAAGVVSFGAMPVEFLTDEQVSRFGPVRCRALSR
jgi:hypothetical protein